MSHSVLSVLFFCAALLRGEQPEGAEEPKGPSHSGWTHVPVPEEKVGVVTPESSETEAVPPAAEIRTAGRVFSGSQSSSSSHGEAQTWSAVWVLPCQRPRGHLQQRRWLQRRPARCVRASGQASNALGTVGL